MDTRLGFPSLRRVAAPALIAATCVLLGANCAEESRVEAPPEAAAVPGSAGGATAEGGAAADEVARAKDVVVYFQPGLLVRVEGLSFSIQPASGSHFELEQVSQQAAALNEQVSGMRPVAVSAVFEQAAGEPGEEAPSAFQIALPAETSQADAEALAARLGESPLVEEAYVPALGEPPGAP